VRIELNNGSIKGKTVFGSAGVIDNHAGEQTTITSFEDMLEASSGGNKIMPPSKYDKVVQASELSVKELTELYLKLGIKSAAGDKAEIIPDTYSTPSNSIVSNDAGTKGLPFKVPNNLVDIFREASKKYGVDYDVLVSVASAESDFNPNCTSKSGAMGIMQLMPATAKYVGVKDAYDPQENIMGGAKYLAEKLKEHGSVKLGIAAYNAGSNAVEKYGGVPPYTETQNYVKKILGFLGTNGTETGLISGKSSKNDTSGNTLGATQKDGRVLSADNKIDNTGLEDAVVTVGDTVMSYNSYLKYISLLQ